MLKDEEIKHLKEELGAAMAQNPNNFTKDEAYDKTHSSLAPSTENPTEVCSRNYRNYACYI